MLAVWIALAHTTAAAAEPATVVKCYSVHDKVIGAGTNIGGPAKAADEGACCSRCQSFTGNADENGTVTCKAWTFHPDGLDCYLHSSDQNQESETGVISGVPGSSPPPKPKPPPPYTPPPFPPPRSYPSAAAACAAFDTNTKIELMHGFGWGTKGPTGKPGIDGYTRNSGCGNACGRPYFRWDNGPQGFGDGAPKGDATQWPSSVNMAATFSPELSGEWGVAMGEEFWNKGSNIFEGPGVCIARIEKNGRTFEYLSGEDPVLGGNLASPLVDGIQQNVMAITKHFMLNNQETDRSGGNMIADEKTMMELYFPPFAAVANKTAGYMCSYNRINGVYACENPETLSTMLKGYANFKGFVVSDWGATHSVSPAINAGLDIDMPDGHFYNELSITAALAVKNITADQLNDSCVRIMSGWFNIPEDRRSPCGGGICIDHNVSTPANKQLAHKLSAMSTVLLQNEGNLLPLDKSNTKLKIALIGADAAAPYTAGSGSGGVPNSNVAVTPLEAFTKLGFDIVYDRANSTASAAAAAASADVAIVFGSAHSGEGHDRTDLLFFPPSGAGPTVEDVILAVAKAQKKTVVVAACPGQILTDWRTEVASILVPFLPGEQYGNAITDVIFGVTVPQAKLPVTFPNVDNEQKMTVAQWPGLESTVWENTKEANYSEGQIVGYRWYDKHEVAPAFGFGHGLTYGGFKYSDLTVQGRTVSFTVAGTGCDTPQIYLGYPDAKIDAKVPVKVLRAFQKICSPTASVKYTFSDRDLSNWDLFKKAYTVTKGTFTVYVGSSSQDIRFDAPLVV